MSDHITVDPFEFDRFNFKHLLEAAGMNVGGRAQKFFTSEVARIADPYVPMDSGTLAGTALTYMEADAIHYIAPYAGYLYEGKLMVDPKYGVGAFHDKQTGRFWSRKGVQKIPDPHGRSLNFDKTTHPKATAHWVDVAWSNHGDEVIGEIEQFIAKNMEDNL